MPHGEPRSPTLNSESRSPKSEGVKIPKSKVQGGQNPEVQSPRGSKTRSPKSKVPRGGLADSTVDLWIVSVTKFSINVVSVFVYILSIVLFSVRMQFVSPCIIGGAAAPTVS